MSSSPRDSGPDWSVRLIRDLIVETSDLPSEVLIQLQRLGHEVRPCVPSLERIKHLTPSIDIELDWAELLDEAREELSTRLINRPHRVQMPWSGSWEDFLDLWSLVVIEIVTQASRATPAPQTQEGR